MSAWIAEEDQSTWKEAFHIANRLSDRCADVAGHVVTPCRLESCCALRRYKSVLQVASDALVDRYGQNSGVLVLNLGPAWGNHEAYELFQDNVIEIAFKEWESPPGLGMCPLDVIFSVCHTASSWLAQNEKHVVVSLT